MEPTRKKPAYQLALMALFVISGAPATARSDNSEWILNQDSPHGGLCTVYLSQNAAKIYSKHYGFDLVCKAPDWKVHAVRKQEKKEWVGNLDQFSGGMLMDPLSVKPPPNQTITVPDKLEDVAGLHCRKYTTKSDNLERVWGAQDISVNRKICEFLCRYYESADIPQVVIQRMVYEKPLAKGKKVTFLLDLKTTGKPGYKLNCKTISWKKTPLNTHDFDIPKCEKLRRLGEITFSRGQKADIQDAIESLGFQSDEPKR